ncbi:Alkanesulfonate monooxygenase [Parageobacillus genomosp. 1]|uniref:Alkanesulfonate monooxygenase n=1 Tax=Parageobacillus genomosp. 1 TaxID=1295642 RepID=A0ABC9VBG8_9BACL|nr:Alkanesulfonate monooxygenase [Parageobacillus genomosp. 1]
MSHRHGGGRRSASIWLTEQDERYDRTEEFVQVLKGMWTNDVFHFRGKFYEVKGAHLAPKPVQKSYSILYAGGESERGKQAIVEHCDAFLRTMSTPIQTTTRRRRRAPASLAC